MVQKKGKVTAKGKVSEPEWSKDAPVAKSTPLTSPAPVATTFEASDFIAFMAKRYEERADCAQKLTIQASTQKPFAPCEDDVLHSIQTLLQQKPVAVTSESLNSSSNAADSKVSTKKSAWGPGSSAAENIDKMRKNSKKLDA
eukprot:GDKJ01014256.1.p1 GENE.GDKJ01014256.1~~GDKJ01014256.1.p1  ORF type:complete len:142 (-),score=34.52 GDKJ01014256.1:144-569(-)